MFIDGNGNWSTDGCKLVSYSNNFVTCHCDHLTNFACLVVSLTYFFHSVLYNYHWLYRIYLLELRELLKVHVMPLLHWKLYHMLVYVSH